MNEGRWVTISGRRVFIRTNEHPMNSFLRQPIKDKKEHLKYLNEEYKDILRWPIETIKLRSNWGAGMGSSGKGGHYINEYHATLKPRENSTLSETIAETNLHKLEEKLNKRRKKDGRQKI